MSLVLPPKFELVGAALLTPVLVLFGQMMIVSRRRKAAGIRYPQLYAEKAEMEKSPAAHLFNCAQRAHQNTLENIPNIYTTTLIAGTKYPVVAAAMCGLWSIGRIGYTYGYISGKAEKRVNALYSLGALGNLVQLGLAIYIAGGWVIGAVSQ